MSVCFGGFKHNCHETRKFVIFVCGFVWPSLFLPVIVSLPVQTNTRVSTHFSLCV